MKKFRLIVAALAAVAIPLVMMGCSAGETETKADPPTEAEAAAKMDEAAKAADAAAAEAGAKTEEAMKAVDAATTE